MLENVYENFRLIQKAFFCKKGVTRALQAHEELGSKMFLGAKPQDHFIFSIHPSIFCLATPPPKIISHQTQQ